MPILTRIPRIKGGDPEDVSAVEEDDESGVVAVSSAGKLAAPSLLISHA